MATKRHWSDALKQQMDEDTVKWAQGYDSLEDAWQARERGDWMLWLAGRCAIGPERKTIVLASCECARLSLGFVPPSEDRPRIAVELAERWARQDKSVSLGDVARAAEFAVDAAHMAEDNVIKWAAAAAANAAHSAHLLCPADQAYSAAAWAAEAYAERQMAVMKSVSFLASLKKSAAIVHKYYPTAPQSRAWQHPLRD